jgi:hypothetical protein
MSHTENAVGNLIPREPVITLGVNRISINIKELAQQLPQITPPADPSLCASCSTITLDSLLSSGKPVHKDAETGRITMSLGASEARLVLDWDSPQESFKRCPMCRLLACDKVWASGVSPYSRYFEGNRGAMQLQLEVSGGRKVKMWFPAQMGLEKDTGEMEIFAFHGKDNFNSRA